VSGGASASFVYDGDGNRVKRTLDGVTTIYVGQHHEKNLSTGEVTTYYYASGQRVAMRKAGVVSFLHTDHLGSTSLTTAVNGYQVGNTQRYELYGEPRTPVLMSTDRLYTGQVFDRNVELMYYGARYYDPALGRFVQADTIVPQPGNPQALNRYSYVLNNPLRYTDPSGHWLESLLDWVFITYDIHQIRTEGWTTENTLALVADVACLILPGATGGGPGTRLALAGGGEVAARAVVRVPAGARAAQTGLKVLQFAQQSPSGEGPSSGADAFKFTPRSDEIFEVGRRMGPTEKMHWIPRAFHEKVKGFYPRISPRLLEFTEPLERGFHKFVHGKWGTLADSYNDFVARWLDEYGSIKSLDDFLQYIDDLRSEYLDLYEQYLTGG
jgi:RHS repeat-associated protein